MSLDAAIDQPVTGVRIVEMDRPRLSDWFARRWRRLNNRLTQQVLGHLMRRGVEARADPAAFAREVERWRDLRRRSNPSTAVLASIGAVQVAGPYQGLPSPPVPADWFAPLRGETRGFVFYVHGGSFIFERSPDVTDLVARFAADAGARVFAPNYRLAPEHPCPAAVDDIVAAYDWMRRTWPDEPVMALGESAGSAVLLAALQRIRDNGGALPAGVLLLSPWVDLSLQSWSVIAASMAGTTGSTMETLGMMAHLYLDERPASDPVASPLFGDFTGFPPMTIHASKGDILFDDAVRLAERIRAANGDLTVRLWTEEAHVWERLPTAKARQSIELSVEFIRRCLARGQGRAN